MKISRRTVIFTALAGGALLALPLTRQGIYDLGYDVITRHFGKAVADDPRTAMFLKDYTARLGSRYGSARYAMDLYFNYGLNHFGLIEEKQKIFEEKLLQSYVLSSNIMQVVKDQGSFEYNGLFDPYQGACINPLSHHYIAGGTTS